MKRAGHRASPSPPQGRLAAERPEGVRGPGARPTSPGAALPPNFVLLGEFGRAHGLRGELRVKSYTADPLAIGTYGPLTADSGRQFTFVDLRQAAGDQP